MRVFHHRNEGAAGPETTAPIRDLSLRLRPALAFFLACLVAACAARPGPDVLTSVAALPNSKAVTVYVATNRLREFPDSNIYTDARALRLNYAQFRISIPPGHRAGEIEWPNGRSDPATSFAIVQQKVLDDKAFARTIAAAGHVRSKIGVFVHGYNTNFQEALYRFAQMTADAGVDGVPILFAWPSAAEVTGYLKDRDAATASRDQLVELLTSLAQQPSEGKITVIGHSMGARLTAEALRQLRLMHRDAVLARLRIILAAPDIDLDVFRTQLEVIGPLSPPMTVLVSRDDVALSLSSTLAGARKRLGIVDVSDPRVQAAALKANLQIVDITQLKASDEFNHDRFVSLAADYHRITATANAGGSDLRHAGAYVFDSVGATLASPFNLAGTALLGK